MTICLPCNMVVTMRTPRGKRIDHPDHQKGGLDAATFLHDGMLQAEVVRQLPVSRQTVHRWALDFEAGGLAGLKWNGQIARPARLTPQMKARLAEALEMGAPTRGYLTGLWTARRAAEVICKEFSIRYHKGYV